MYTLSYPDYSNSELDTLSDVHDQQMLHALADAADAANARYLALRSVAGSSPADIESAQHHWLVLERLRHKLAARDIAVRPDRNTFRV